MAVYLDAPDSGSMFQNILEADINIYAVSSASASEDSYASYCAPYNVVNDVPMLTCLGDRFSTGWIEDAEQSNMATKTLYDEFVIDQQECITQSVLQWGQVSMQSEVLGNFMSGNVDSWWKNLKHNFKSKAKKVLKAVIGKSAATDTNSIASRDVKLHNLYSAVMADPSAANQEALQAEIDHRLYVD